MDDLGPFLVRYKFLSCSLWILLSSSCFSIFLGLLVKDEERVGRSCFKGAQKCEKRFSCIITQWIMVQMIACYKFLLLMYILYLSVSQHGHKCWCKVFFFMVLRNDVTWYNCQIRMTWLSWKLIDNKSIQHKGWLLDIKVIFCSYPHPLTPNNTQGFYAFMMSDKNVLQRPIDVQILWELLMITKYLWATIILQLSTEKDYRTRV